MAVRPLGGEGEDAGDVLQDRRISLRIVLHVRQTDWAASRPPRLSEVLHLTRVLHRLVIRPLSIIRLLIVAHINDRVEGGACLQNAEE